MTPCSTSCERSSRWERTQRVDFRPVRLLHRGGIEPKDDESMWLAGGRSLAYGVDSCATAVMRLGVTPVMTARTSSRKAREVGGYPGAVAGAMAGFLYGLPKGLLGAGISLGTGAGCFLVAPIAQLVGVAFEAGDGLRRAALATDELFVGQKKKADKRN